MLDAVVGYLNEVPLASLMLVVMLGFLLGRLRWRGVSVGPAGGTVVAAIALGHLGLSLTGLYGTEVPEVTVGTFGFALFIYSVGFEAGPRFFSSLRGRTGWRFVLVGAVINILSVLAAWGYGVVAGLDASSTAGVLSGALTSAPTFAAASEVAPEPTRLSVHFALTYPVGLVGLVLVLQLLPRRVYRSRSLKAPSWAETRERKGPKPEHGWPEVDRTFEVTQAKVVGVPLRDLDLPHATGCVIERVRRGDQSWVPDAGTVLQQGDRILVRGRADELRELQGRLGREIYDDALKGSTPNRRIQVTRPGVAGRTLEQLRFIERYHVIVASIESGDQLLEPTAEAVLHRGDVVELAGDPQAVRAASREIGRFEPPTTQTDIAIYAGGILIGLMLGSVRLTPIGLPFSLGLSGGLLLAGVLLGRLRQIGPFSANVPLAARQLVRDLGILLFVGETGLQAGMRLAAEKDYAPGESVLGALVVMVTPLLITLVFGRYVLRMRGVDVLGSACGGMTSSAALVVLKRASASNEPAVSYAAAYTVGSVLVTIAGPVLVSLM
jgi:putative transport protein